MASPAEVSQMPPLGECPEPPARAGTSVNVESPQTWPYEPVELICCAVPDRPFELMSEDECKLLGHSKFEWPIWEAEYGCVRPSSRRIEDPEVCCFFTDRTYLRSVVQKPYSECVLSSNHGLNAVPLTW